MRTVSNRKTTEKLSGIGRKMLSVFMALLVITAIVVFLSGTVLYGRLFNRFSGVYLCDITNQTTNNLEAVIETVEDIHVQILASPVLQEQLRIVNCGDVDGYTKRNIKQTIEREFATSVLLNPHICAANIISKSGTSFSITNIDGMPVTCAFTEDEIYKANGTTLWKLIGEEHNVCTAKAILDLKTMMPIGYSNIIFEQGYFEDIVKDNSTEFSSCTYVVDKSGTIVSTNRRECLNTVFPLSVSELQDGHGYHYDVLNDEYAYYYTGDAMPNGWILVQSVSSRELNKNRNRILYTTGVLLVLILLFGYVMTKAATRYIIKPTRELVESMKLFGKGNLSHRVAVTTQDEIGQIGNEYNRMADNIETLIEKVYKMEIAQKQAEIDFLCMQINPHFLYNTLDTISWMAIGEQNMEISEMTIALADLLRAMVKSDRFITVEEEMKTVRDYLYIQEQRFQDKIMACYEVDEKAYPYEIPNFILQPLIENAIIHGLEPKLEKGTLWIRICVEDGMLLFCVQDDGVGMTAEEIERLYQECEENDTNQNIGLKNVYRRLILCYGQESRLSIQSQKNQGTRIAFRIPASQGSMKELRK